MKAMRFGMLAAALTLAPGGCWIADSHKPLWLEAHGHFNLSWISAFENGALGIGPGGRIVRSPGEWNTPWQDQMPSAGAQIAAVGNNVWTLTDDGSVMRRTLRGDDAVSLTNGGGIQRFSVSTQGVVHALSRNHPQRLDDGRLVDTPCASRDAKSLAVGRDGTYVVTSSGALALETVGGACQDLVIPFTVLDVAATDVDGATFDIAAVDSQQRVWWRKDGQWEKLPRPIVYRRGRWPREVDVIQVSLSAQGFWARSVDGLVFIFSDPR